MSGEAMDESYKQVYVDPSKTEAFVKRKWRSTEAELFESEKELLGRIVKNGQSMLDVGCASGGLYNILKQKFDALRYTGIDIDSACISAARREHPGATFVAGDLYQGGFKEDSFDVVVSLMTMSMQPDYKKFIQELVRVSGRYVLFDVRLKYEGSTIVDRDVSYFYYHGSGVRNYYVVHNVFELLNFLHVDSLHLKSIRIDGYYPADKTSALVPFPKSQLMTGMVCLEKYPKAERSRVVRQGGFKEHADRPWCAVSVNLPGFEEGWL